MSENDGGAIAERLARLKLVPVVSLPSVDAGMRLAEGNEPLEWRRE